MNCTLCLKTCNELQLIDIAGDEAQSLSAGSIIHHHFPFYFQSAPDKGHVCRKCWLKVSVFHEFYLFVESVHAARHTVYLDCDIDLKDVDEAGGSFSEAEDCFGPGIGHDDDFSTAASTESVACDQSAEKNEKNPKSTKKVRKSLDESVKKKAPLKGAGGTFQCQICGMHFLAYNRLERHIKEIHDVKEFKCSYLGCVESFTTQTLLDHHFGSNHTRTECPHCNKMIMVSYLAQHIRKRHDVDTRVICDICGKVSVNSHMHTQHYRAAHIVSEKLQCDICGQCYKTKDTIRVHMGQHIHGPQTCTTCGHVSPNQKALAKHLVKHRPKRWECTVCGKDFIDKRRLTEHSHIHSGFAGSYTCDLCGRVFRFRSSLFKHKKNKQIHLPKIKKTRQRKKCNANS